MLRFIVCITTVIRKRGSYLTHPESEVEVFQWCRMLTETVITKFGPGINFEGNGGEFITIKNPKLPNQLWSYVIMFFYNNKKWNKWTPTFRSIMLHIPLCYTYRYVTHTVIVTKLFTLPTEIIFPCISLNVKHNETYYK